MHDEYSECWLPVVGYEGFYEVSDRGRVRGVARIVIHSTGVQQRIAGRLLHGFLNDRGYPSVCLSRGNSRRTRTVHQLVAEAFIGPRAPGIETRHLDGDPRNNRISNLTYGTRADNARDAMLHGSWARGSENRLAKLTENDVVEIRRRRKAGEGFSSIARDYPADRSTIRCAAKGKTWKHVDEPPAVR